ncbi:MAG: POTRA domain-containing protein [Thermogutta sp.]
MSFRIGLLISGVVILWAALARTEKGGFACADSPVAAIATPATAKPERGEANGNEVSNLPSDDGEQVVEVRVVGAKNLPREKYLPSIKTRAGRPFDVQLLEEDVRRLYRTGLFVDIKTYTPKVPGGRLVVFEVLERPLLHYVKYVGQQAFDEKRLAKETGLKPGDPLDTWQVDEAQRRLERFYREKGFPSARVTVVEGNNTTDRGAIFLINEGRRQRIFWTGFVGNTIATDARLRTQVQTKPGWFWFLGGLFNREQLDEDVERLTAYYRGLGFFRARIGRDIEVYPDPVDSRREWVYVTYVIDEGPRYKVRNISFFGNEKYSNDELTQLLELKPGDYFDQNKLQMDLNKIREKYGAIGHVFADVEPDPRFLEEPGELDLVYRIDEGRAYKVGMINIRIRGESPHTQVTTVLNRMSLAPGDIADIREIRASERRLRASQIFEVDPTRGALPKIAFSPPELPVTADGSEGPRIAERPEPKGVVPASATSPAPSTGPTTSTPPSVTAPADVFRGQDGAGGITLPSPPGWVFPKLVGRKGATTSNASGVIPAVGTVPAGSPSQGVVKATYETSANAPGGVTLTANENTDVAIPATSGGNISGGFGQIEVSDMTGGSFRGPDTSPQTIAPPGSRFVFPDRPLPGDASMFSDRPPDEMPLELPLEPLVEETRTGRMLFSIGVNSDAGVMGSAIIEEQNFDWTRWPRSWRDIIEGKAWRGAGQRFRLEAVPGSRVHRYMVSFSDPYFMNRNLTFGLSGFYYRRDYYEYLEERVGGRVVFGYQFTHDLSGTVAYRGSDIRISDPISTPWGTPATIEAALGTNILHGFEIALTHDTRDNSFLPTEGHFFQVSFEQVIGTYDYPRVELDYRRYFALRQRPDGSGRHVLGLASRFAVTGDETPVYDHYFAGGTSNLRGFDYRGASPREYGIAVGGHCLLLASAEYMFPITADDMVRGVIFCDTGTVEPTIDSWDQRYRVSLGFGLRLVIPAMGPAPIAFDFGFPVSEEPGDDNRVFNFFIGFLR